MTRQQWMVAGVIALACLTGTEAQAQVRTMCASAGAWVPCTNSAAGSGATEAKQDDQITQETAIAGGVGATGDAAATAGSTGSVNAKLRFITTQLSNLLTTTQFQTAFGTGSVVSGDPCDGGTKSVHVINTSTATTVEIANAVASQFFYICAINLVAAGAQTVAIVEDDTDGVGSPTAGLNGGTSAATGWSFPANGGISLGTGSGTVMKTGTANRYLGIITGSAVQTSGTIVYVSAP